MPRDKAAAETNDDIGWKFAKVVPGDRHRTYCKLCGRKISGGITRLKQHLAYMKGQVRACPNVSLTRNDETPLKYQGKKKLRNRKRDEVVA